MTKYLDNRHPEIKEYHKILSPEFPSWLVDYIETIEMQRIHTISQSCGVDYSGIFNLPYFYSSLDHSVSVALILWNFTGCKKQTLAGLFHDIATPVFKHVIDFLNNDHETQESTEEKTKALIMNAPDIMVLLNRDGISVEEIYDYKIYPLADNDTPRVAADRLEYNFSSGLSFARVWDLDGIRESYNNLILTRNEDGLPEFAFKDLNVAEKYIQTVSKLWPKWIENPDKLVMQFLADMVRMMVDSGYLTLEGLYTLSELEVVDMIRNCEDDYLREAFKKFQDATISYEGKYPVEHKYCVSIKAKQRYVVPLVIHEDRPKRITEISSQASKDIHDFLNHQELPYAYFDFDFKPEAQKRTLNKQC